MLQHNLSIFLGMELLFIYIVFNPLFVNILNQVKIEKMKYFVMIVKSNFKHVLKIVKKSEVSL